MADELSLAGRLMGDMPPDLLRFIKDKVTSFIDFDLIRFFYESRSTHNTAENVAQSVGHNAEAIQTALITLVANGVLDVTLVDGVSVYSLAQNSEMRALLERFVPACEDAEFRTKVIFHIIRRMR
jgi:hypothetical protein